MWRLTDADLGVLLAVAAIGFLLIRREPSVFVGGFALFDQVPQKTISAGQYTFKAPYNPPGKKATQSTPAQRAKSSGGGAGGPDTKAKYDKANAEQAARNAVATYWKNASPAVKQKIINTWIDRARKLMRARILAAIKAKQSGYQTVGYTGGFGGTISPNTPPITGAVGANTLSAWEEALGLKPITNQSAMSAAQKKMGQTATDAIGRYAKCEGNKACQATAAKDFDKIVFSKTTALINSMRLANKGADPTQSMA